MPILLLDILIKWSVQRYLYPYIPFAYPYGGLGVFKNFLGIQFSLVYETNTGAAWGFFSNYPYILLIARLLIIVGIIYYVFSRSLKRFELFSICLILAGAIGNVLDIFFYGAVIDMFKCVLWGYAFPVFNLADSAIFIGIVLYFISQLRKTSHAV